MHREYQNWSKSESKETSQKRCKQLGCYILFRPAIVPSWHARYTTLHNRSRVPHIPKGFNDWWFASDFARFYSRNLVVFILAVIFDHMTPFIKETDNVLHKLKFQISYRSELLLWRYFFSDTRYCKVPIRQGEVNPRDSTY